MYKSTKAYVSLDTYKGRGIQSAERKLIQFSIRSISKFER